MKLENQVTSLEISKRLKELGVPQVSVFYWKDNWLNYRPSVGNADYSAFTVAELGEMLPTVVKLEGENRWFTMQKNDVRNYRWIATYLSMSFDPILDSQKADTEADARGKMMIYLLENKLITI